MNKELPKNSFDLSPLLTPVIAHPKLHQLDYANNSHDLKGSTTQITQTKMDIYVNWTK